MERILLSVLLLLCLAVPEHSSSAMIKPQQQSVIAKPATHPKTSLRRKDIEKQIGRKLTFRERIGLFLLKRLPANVNAGQTALTFGIIAASLFVIGLFVPYVLLGAFITAIVAVVLGTVAKKENPDDRKAAAATLLGWITLGATALLLLLAVLVVAAWF